MSAYLVSPQDIARMAIYIQRQLHTLEFARELATLLAQENLASVCYRYKMTPEEAVQAFLGVGLKVYLSACQHGTLTAPNLLERLTPTDAADLARTIRYQSCEHPTWLESDACKLLEYVITREPARASL